LRLISSLFLAAEIAANNNQNDDKYNSTNNSTNNGTKVVANGLHSGCNRTKSIKSAIECCISRLRN
jgi:hypothetical protein